MLRKLIYYMFYPIELFLRFWFPYAFKDDPYNPEPQTKEDRKRRRQDKKENRSNKASPTTVRRDNFKERKKVKDDIKNKESKNDKRTDAEILANVQKLKKVNTKKPKELGLQMVDLSKDLSDDSALEMLQSSEPRLAFYWHDDVSHQVAVRFDKGGIKDEYKTRSNGERRKLEPLIRPYQKGNVDRTHVIPIGYHGSEKDKRLLIGFDSHINQVKLKNFEEYASKVNKQKTILWFVDIQRQDNDSVKWHATVWGEKGEIIIKKTFHDKRKFKWSQRRF
ncbi:hypothetical protein [Staphylococcus equorum]|uniref:hypothetical protein n=1 Tax=Staphylococcus equorum TaxID=246432 RepID=UPI003FD6C4C7